METIIFFGIPAHGHINPTLPIVRELINRKKRVVYYCTNEFSSKIESSGAEFRPYKIDIMNNDNKKIAKNFISLTRSILESTDDIIEQHLDEVRKENPVCIIHDSFCTWARCIAKVLNIRAVCSTTIFPIGDKFLNPAILLMILSSFSDFYKFKKLSKYYRLKYNIKIDLKNTLINKEDLNIVYSSKYLQPNSEGIDESYKYVGPSISTNEENIDLDSFIDKPTDKKLVYISLGTVLNNNVGFYRKCIEAFAKKDFVVIMSIGESINIKELGEIPDNFIVKNYWPQLRVLQLADMFISHAGMNSVHEALYYGVPLILVPQQVEQMMIGKRVEELGAGICLNKRIKKNMLKDSVDKVFNNKSFSENAAIISKTLRDAGGYKAAADIICENII